MSVVSLREGAESLGNSWGNYAFSRWCRGKISTDGHGRAVAWTCNTDACCGTFLLLGQSFLLSVHLQDERDGRHFFRQGGMACMFAWPGWGTQISICNEGSDGCMGRLLREPCFGYVIVTFIVVE